MVLGDRRKIWWAALALAGSACIVRSSPHAPTSSETIRYATRQLELDNGLRVVLEQAPDFGVASAALVVSAGSAHEPPGKAGLAHLTEHVVFNATHAGVSFQQWARSLDPNVNATTSWDETTYYALEDTDRLEDMLVFLLGAVREPLAGVDTAVFQREWRAVSNERRMRTEEGTPGQAEGWLMAAAFPAAHPYAHPVVGTADSLGRLGFEDVRSFVAAHYRPERGTLVINAPLPLDAQQELLERIAGVKAKVQLGRPALPQPLTPAFGAAARSFETRLADVATPTLWLGWPVPSDFDPRGDIAPLLARILEVRSWRGLTERDRDIGAVNVGVIPGKAASLLFVRVALKEGKHPEETARAIADELRGGLGSLTADGDPLEVVSRIAGTEYIYREESLLVRTRNMASSYSGIGLPTFLRTRGERMTKLAWGHLNQYIEAFLGAEQQHAVLIRPGVEREPAAVAPSPDPQPAGLVPASVAVPGTRAAQTGAPVSKPLLRHLETHVLPNGLTVIVLPRPGSTFHTVLLGFKGGYAHASPPGVTVATDWGRRFDVRTSPQVQGIDYRHRITDSGTLEELRSTGADVQLTLQHLRQVLGFSVFWPPREFHQRAEVYEREGHMPAALLERELHSAVYAGQALGTPPTAKQIEKITPSEVTRWVSKVRRPGNGVLVIVGNVDPEAAVSAARAELGSWAEGAARGPIAPPALLESLPDGDRGRVVFQHRPGSRQATLRLKCVLPRATADNLAARTVFADAWHQVLREEFRERGGASYHVFADVDVLPGGTAVFDLGADVDHDLLRPVLARLRHLLTSPEGTFTSGTFERIRLGTAGRFRRQAATTRAVAVELFETWNRDWPLQTLDQMPERALSTTMADVETLAGHCRENWIVGLLGDEPRLRAAWSQVR